MVRGKKDTYVGMYLDYRSPGGVILSVDSYIKEAIGEFPEEIMKTIKKQVRKHLFKVNNACVNLCKIDMIIFHRLVENLLFLRKRTRPDIQPIIAFLMTRVQNLDEEDWKKLQRVLSYLNATINSVKLHLNANNLNVSHWWFNASYGTHP